MRNKFCGSEIVEIGVQIEINGRDFYNTLVKNSKDVKAKEVFAYLAGEEEKHIMVFKQLLEGVEKYQPQAADAYSADYFVYMNALASQHIFTQKDKGKEAAKRIKTDKEAVELGIGFEKDSIIFYEGMKEVIPEQDLKILDALIKEEQKHLIQLTELKMKI